MEIIQDSDPHWCSISQETLVAEKILTMALKEFSSMIRFLVLMLVLMDLSFGKPTKLRKNKEEVTNCPNQENARFPENVIKVHINIANTEHIDEAPHDISNKSLSPWDSSISEDFNRIPHVIVDASCRHSNACLDLEGHLTHAVNSVPIKQEILVLKRKQVGCQQIYSLEKQVITVGCTCAAVSTQTYFTKSG